MNFKLKHHVGVLIKKSARLYERVANRDLERLGVTYAQMVILVRLWDADGLSQMELAQSAGLKQPTVVRLLDRMERDKLITRDRNKDDGRVFNFFMTDKAKKICQKLEGHVNFMRALTTHNFTKNEIDTLNKLILKVIANLQGPLNEKIK